MQTRVKYDVLNVTTGEEFECVNWDAVQDLSYEARIKGWKLEIRVHKSKRLQTEVAIDY